MPSRYSKIQSTIWSSDKFNSVNEFAQKVYLYLLCCPHGNSAGLYRLPEGYAVTDLRCTQQRYKAALDTLKDAELIETDGEIVFVYQFLRFNPYTNANHAKGSAKEIAEFTDNPLYSLLRSDIETYCEAYREHFPVPNKAYRKPIESLSKGFQNCIDSGFSDETKPIDSLSTPIPIPIPIPNTKTKREKGLKPPTLSDVEAYCREKNLTVDANRFYEFFTAGNWIDSRGHPVRNWKQKLLTWDNHAPKKTETKQPDYSKGDDFFD